MNAIPDLWKMYRDSGCKCQVEDAAGDDEPDQGEERGQGEAMKFIKSAKANGAGFSAEFCNGEITKSNDAASFFMVMEDKGGTIDELDGYIRIVQMVEPNHDWKEIIRIAASFAAKKGCAR